MMGGWRDRVEKLRGRTRFVVLRIMLHLWGEEAPPQLGVFNRVAQSAIEAEGDLEVMGEGLVEICESLLRIPSSWQAIANEGDVFGMKVKREITSMNFLLTLLNAISVMSLLMII